MTITALSANSCANGVIETITTSDRYHHLMKEVEQSIIECSNAGKFRTTVMYYSLYHKTSPDSPAHIKEDSDYAELCATLIIQELKKNGFEAVRTTYPQYNRVLKGIAISWKNVKC